MKKVYSACWGVLLSMLAGCGDSKDSAPGAPQGVLAQAADAWALLSWEPPATDGGHPLLYYMVRCEPRCGGAIVSASQRQALVPGLENGIAYSFTVSALNKKGEGPTSVPSERVTPRPGAAIPNPTAPGHPRAVRTTPGNGQVYVSWLAPASHGGRPVRAYRVTAHPGGASVTVDASAASAVIEGLENGRAFTFTVVAINELGDGAPAVSEPVRPSSGGPPARWVSGYWVGYKHDDLPAEKVDLTALTHLIVGRFNPQYRVVETRDPKTGVVTHTDRFVDSPEVTPDPDWARGETWARERATLLSGEAEKSGRKALLMLGGYGANWVLAKASTPELRTRFVASLLKLMDDLGYQGIDLDWEPIDLDVKEGATTSDGENLLALLDELRAAKPDIILTVPVHALNPNIPMTGNEPAFVAQLAARVDQLNIMSYGQAFDDPSWESWHSSALGDATPNRPSTVASAVQMYLDVGVPTERLGVGIGYFGQCWQRVTEPRVPLATRQHAVIRRVDDNVMSYFNIMTDYYEPEARRWDARASAPYLTFPFGKGSELCNFISYEDSQSILAKGRYVRQKGLGGTIIWNLNHGHFPNAPEGQENPLSAAVRSAFLDP